MFIHGKLFLTEHNIMLDEVRSLLQKSLRRKEWVLALQATKELVAFKKDQLPWKSIITYLFEDHCLSDTDVLMSVYKATQENNVNAKYKCIELLMECKTCRIAACLPVAALDAPYEPKRWDSSIEVDQEIQGLVANRDGLINTDLLLAHLLDAWKNQKHDPIMTYMKLATMVLDNEKRDITAKGKAYLINTQIKKPNFGQIVLSALYKNTDDAVMRGYLAACHRLTTIPEVCIRLILFAPVTRLMFSKYVTGIPEKKPGRVDWKTVRRLKYMPGWAVDKHTFRGKFGRGTKSILKKQPPGMSDEGYEEFHGEREKRDIESFFNEGVKCTKEAMSDNPFWERTKEIYLSQSSKKQKTAHMTADYYKKIRTKYPKVFKATRIVSFDRNDSFGASDELFDEDDSFGPLFGPPKKTKGEKLSGQNLIDKFLNKGEDKTHISDSVSGRNQPLYDKKRSKSQSDSKEQHMKNKKTSSIDKSSSDFELLSDEDFESMAARTGCPKTLPKNLFEEDEIDTKRSMPDMYRIETKQLLADAYGMDGVSRAKKRRMQESVRRLSEYATECSEIKSKGKGKNRERNSESDTSINLTSSPLNSFHNSRSRNSFGSIEDGFGSSEDDSGFITIENNTVPDSPFSSPSTSSHKRTAHSSSSKTKNRKNGNETYHSENIFEGLEHELSFDLDESDFQGTNGKENGVSDIEKEDDDENEDESMENDENADEEEEDNEEEEEEEEEVNMLSLRGPLLQIPTSVTKTYTVADLDINRVVKGPYRDKTKMHRVMFLHQSMTDVIGDPHTLDFEPENDFLTFPLLKGENASMEVGIRDFTDCITKAPVEGAEFLTRDALGLVQLHRLKVSKILKLPVTIWAHFMFRFALDVGDSGLYNALTDDKLSFVYGIDMEEHRGSYTKNKDNKEESLTKMMFSKEPKRELCDAIRTSMLLKKTELFRIVCKQINYAQLDRLAREYNVDYKRQLFIERIKMCRQAVARLKAPKTN